MQFSVKQINELLGGEIKGDENVQVASVAELQHAGEGDLSFFSNKKYEDLLYATSASAVLVSSDFEPKKEVNAVLIKVSDPYSAFGKMLGVVEKFLVVERTGVEQPSHIASSASIAEDCFIGAFAYIGENVTIGKGTRIYPNVFIGDNVTIGEGCILYPGSHVMYNCVLGNYVTLLVIVP